MPSSGISRWIKHHRKRILLCGVVYASSFTGLISLPPEILRQIFGPISNPYFTILWQLIFVISSVFILTVSWFAADLLPDVASSLGYSKDAEYQIHVSGAGNVVTIPNKAVEKLNFPLQVTEKYDVNNLLSPLDVARLRILDHISKLRNNSVTNLFVGIGIAGLGLVVLSTALLQVPNFSDSNHIFDFKNYALSALLPKLSITLFVQVFSYFFLAMYRSNQSDIRYFQNEITLIDSLAAAVIVCQVKTNNSNLKTVVAALSKNERNRLMKKSEKVIASNDEVEIVKTLDSISHILHAKQYLQDGK